MNTAMNILFYAIIGEVRRDNDPIETAEISARLDELHEFITSTGVKCDDEIYESLNDLYCLTRESAFKFGFKTAFEMFIELTTT